MVCEVNGRRLNLNGIRLAANGATEWPTASRRSFGRRWKSAFLNFFESWNKLMIPSTKPSGRLIDKAILYGPGGDPTKIE